MSIGVYIFFSVVVLSLWFIAGHYELRLSTSTTQKIKNMYRRRGDKEVQNEATIPVTLNIEAWEFIYTEIEKEVYMIRKSKKTKIDSIEMNVCVSAANGIKETEKEKTKMRMENRFSGLTVNFCKEEKEEENAFLYCDE